MPEGQASLQLAPQKLPRHALQVVLLVQLDWTQLGHRYLHVRSDCQQHQTFVGTAESVAVRGAGDGTRRSKHAILAATEVDIGNAETVDIAWRITSSNSDHG